MGKHIHEGKTWKVYELYDIYGSIVYVGCSHDPIHRFNQHTKNKPTPGQGTFYGRQDLALHIVASYDNRKDALKAEGDLKLEHGFEWTERTTLISNGKKAADSGQLSKAAKLNWQVNWDKMQKAMKAVGARHKASGHIQEIGSASMARQFECPHCGKYGKGAIMGRWHFEKCKKKPVENDTSRV